MRLTLRLPIILLFGLASSLPAPNGRYSSVNCISGKPCQRRSGIILGNGGSISQVNQAGGSHVTQSNRANGVESHLSTEGGANMASDVDVVSDADMGGDVSQSVGVNANGGLTESNKANGVTGGVTQSTWAG